MTPVTIDRIEDEVAVIELREDVLVDVPLVLLPAGVHEGDRLLVDWQLVSSSGAPAWGSIPPSAPTPFGSNLDDDGTHVAVMVVTGRPETTEASASNQDDHAQRHASQLP
jgi:hypothetical protein